MKCGKCSYEESKVVDSRSLEDGKAVRRRRECLACGYRFTTYEKIENTPIMVVKKNGTRQSFNRDKIINGIVRACEKRPVARETIEKICNDIESDLNNRLRFEISSLEIGNMVMDKLKTIDKVAYIRFASVYKEFEDIKEFRKELKNL